MQLLNGVQKFKSICVFGDVYPGLIRIKRIKLATQNKKKTCKGGNPIDVMYLCVEAWLYGLYTLSLT